VIFPFHRHLDVLLSDAVALCDGELERPEAEPNYLNKLQAFQNTLIYARHTLHLLDQELDAKTPATKPSTSTVKRGRGQ
jgi:hypothetical protein